LRAKSLIPFALGRKHLLFIYPNVQFDRPLRILNKFYSLPKDYQMKKTLIALAVLGTVAGVAQAQSNVTIYGLVDIGYVKATGSKTSMDENHNSRIGFMGSEDLGGGLKATFQLEQRFKPYNGYSSGKAGEQKGVFEGAANAGLAGSFGQITLGRLNELSTETLRTLDPFNQDGIAGQPDNYLRGTNNGRLSSTARYDSPNMNGFKVGATYSVQNAANTLYSNYTQQTGAGANDGYAVMGSYTNGPIYLLANYNKAINSNDSYNWNLGGAYTFGPAKVSLAYEQTKDNINDDKEKRWLAGLSYSIGSGVVKASYNHSKWDSNSEGSTQWGLGYQHNLSKRTSLYADYSRTKDTDDDTSNAYMVGITHKF
jgi:general bacterial porin, GBP family